MKLKNIIFSIIIIFSLSCATQTPQVKTNLPPSDRQSTTELDLKLTDLTNQIVNSMLESRKTKIAVIEFSDLDGKVTEFGKFLAEELITRLFLTNKFEVIERNLLNKIMEEHKLSFTGLIDPETAKELGRILGVDAIATGTVTDLGQSVKINSRLITTETGSVFAVAAVNMIKDKSIINLMQRITAIEPRKSKDTHPEAYRSGDVVFKEDFSSYSVGDPLSNWGHGVVVLRAQDGRKCMSSQSPGLHLVSHEMVFPEDFSFEMEFVGKNLRGWTPQKGTNPTLIDTEGREFKILLWGNAPSIQFPGTNYINAKPWNTSGVFRLVKRGSTFKAYWRGDFIVSGDFLQFSRFVGFKFVVHAKDYITNILIKSL